MAKKQESKKKASKKTQPKAGKRKVSGTAKNKKAKPVRATKAAEGEEKRYEQAGAPWWKKFVPRELR